MNRRHLLLASVAALPGIALPGGAVATVTARQRKPKWRSQTVTRTFASTRRIVIPKIPEGSITGVGSAGPYPATIRVKGLTWGRIQKVTVRFTGFSHTWPEDVDVLLVAPNGRSVVLMSDAGFGDGATSLNLTFDDAAPSPLPDPLVSGTFRPTDVFLGPDSFPPPAPAGNPGTKLSVFNGGNPNGRWSLYIVDGPLDTFGALATWSLRITARIKVRTRRTPKPRRKARGVGRR